MKTRPQLGEYPLKHEAKIVSLILAAGQSTRMNGTNKLLATLSGKPLIKHVVDYAIRQTNLDKTLVVTGFQNDRIQAALAGTRVRFIQNPCYAKGLSTSLRAGVQALDDDVTAVLILLGDMPFIKNPEMSAIITAFQSDANCQGVIATHNGKRGHPVLLSSRFFKQIGTIKGDKGARDLIQKHISEFITIEIGDGALRDVDTAAMLKAIGGEA